MSRNNHDDYSVVIPSKDRVSMLAEALDSLFNQTLLPRVVYLVIDEPEDDRKYQFLRSFEARLQVTFTGGGFGGARSRNIGLDNVKTGFVFFLDDDDTWLPEKAKKQIETLKSSCNLIAVTCWRVEEFPQGSREIRIQQRTLSRHFPAYNAVGSFSQFAMRWNHRTERLRLLPGLRSAQDFEFYLQVARQGRIGVTPEILVRYRQHTGPRITGSNPDLLGTFQTVYDQHRSMFNHRQEMFWRARLTLHAAVGPAGLMTRILETIRIFYFLVQSGSLLLSGKDIFKGAALRLIGRRY